MSESPRQHWNEIFSAKEDPQLGWYERDPSQTLKFLDLIPQRKGLTVFLPGAGTSTLVDELLAREFKLVLNDISDKALEKLRKRIGTAGAQIWLHHDISRPLPDTVPLVDLWIDRAVLHFLLEERAIQGYFANLKSVLMPGGYVLLAEFSRSGASKCAGLELHRYSAEEMMERMGEGFELIGHEEYTFVNPFGELRPYIYALFRRESKQ